MGWFKKLTGYSTPKIFKDFDDTFMTPAINTIVKSYGPEAQVMYSGAKSLTHNVMQSEPIKASQVISTVKTQSQIVQENLEKQIMKEISDEKIKLQQAMDNYNKPVEKTDNTVLMVLGFVTSIFLL